MLCLVYGWPSAPLQAQDAPPPNPDFQRGMEALGAGDNLRAAQAFDSAYRADHQPQSLLNLGIAYTNLGLLNHARATLEAYIQEADATRDAQNIAAVRAELERLQASNAVITLRPVPVAEVSVVLDDQPVLPRDQELLVAPGNRHFVISAPGYSPYDQTLAVPAGRFTLDVTLQPLPAAPPVAPLPAVAPAAAAQTAAPPSAAAPAAAGPAQPAASPAQPTADAKAKPEPSPCLMGELCLGPVLALGVPNLVGIGAHLRIGQYFGAGLDYQVFPTLHVSSVAIGTSMLTVEGRLYPFGGSFFLAGGFGYQNIMGRASKDGATIEASVGVPTFKAGLGFMGHDGFVAGIDLGLMFPLAGTDVSLRMLSTPQTGNSITQSQLDATVANLQSDARKGVRDIVHALPFLFQLNLLRLGYLF